MKYLAKIIALVCLFAGPLWAQNPTPVVVTDANGKSLTVTGVASATQVGSPTPVVITDANGKVIALGSGAGITFVAANPATCTPGTTGVVELNVAPYTVSYCSATNTWSPIGSGSGTVSGLTSGQVPIAGSATSVTSSKALQGTDTNILTSGTISGTSVALCTDANGGATTSSCPSGTPAFSAITAGTNTNALVVGTGGSLTVSGTGTNNATTLGGATFASPGTIGGTTPGIVNATNVVPSGSDPWFDVTSATYGADPTGVADSLAAVEAAMTAACATSPSGGVVFFPPGKYTFSNIIPSTSAYWCNGETITGSGVRATELDFPLGSGYAITEHGGTGLGDDIRNLTIKDFMLVVGGGSGGSNLGIGGLFVGNYAFTHEYRNLYIIGPTSSTAAGVSLSSTVPASGTEDAYVSTLDFDNVRVDNFGGTGGYGFYFAVTNTGDLLHCHFCYSTGADIGMQVSFFWTAVLDQSDVDNSITRGFQLQPGDQNTIIGNGLSGEVNQGDLYRIYGNGTSLTGGTVILTNPKSTGENGSSGSVYPIDIFDFAGDVTIINPVTASTGGSSIASLNISGGVPHAVTIVGCDQLLDKGFSSAANTYLSQGQGNICSNSTGSFLSVALTNPAAPTVTPTCTGTCVSTWSYKIVALDSNLNPTAASAAGTTAVNASTLDSTHKNKVTFPPIAGARYYNVYRTASGGTPANLSLLCTNLTQSGITGSNAIACTDDGSVNTATATPSTVNKTGLVTTPLMATTTNCAGAGTGANPSVVTCTAAPSGAFSCATNASTGTCTVNTTAVTTNSNILVQPTGATTVGTRLSVTCNTTADTALTAPRLAAIVNATSFTINLGTFSTNPECFEYWVVN